MFLRKFKNPIVYFQIEAFFLIYFFSVFFCISIAVLTIIRTTKWQTAHINKASNISKIINCNYDIMVKPRYDVILIFPKTYLIFSYLEVILSILTYKITFASLRYLYSHKTQTCLWWCWLISNFSVVMVTDLIKCNYGLPKANRSHSPISPKANRSHSRIFPKANRSHSRISPKANRSYSRIFPKASRSHSGIFPKANRSHSRIFPKANRSHSHIFPKASRSHSRIFPKANSSHSRIFPKASRSYSHIFPKANRSYSRIFSVGIDFLFSNVLKDIFVLGTSSSPSFKCIV